MNNKASNVKQVLRTQLFKYPKLESNYKMLGRGHGSSLPTTASAGKQWKCPGSIIWHITPP